MNKWIKILIKGHGKKENHWGGLRPQLFLVVGTTFIIQTTELLIFQDDKLLSDKLLRLYKIHVSGIDLAKKFPGRMEPLLI